jgi:hypothetical protein
LQMNRHFVSECRGKVYYVIGCMYPFERGWRRNIMALEYIGGLAKFVRTACIDRYHNRFYNTKI